MKFRKNGIKDFFSFKLVIVIAAYTYSYISANFTLYYLKPPF